MSESPATPLLLAELRRIASRPQAARAERPDRSAPDRSAEDWPATGLARGQLHEIYAQTAGDGASGAGFAVALAVAARAMPLLWLRTEKAERQGGRVHATGLVEFGFDASALILATLADVPALLRAAADAARCGGLGTLIVEAWGRAPEIDLTATRRLMLAAEASGVTVLLLRIEATPVASAAATRWGVAAGPSRALEADAPGLPAFDVELLRRRGGPAGQRWQVEWNRDAYRFEPTHAFVGAPLSRPAIPLGPGRAAPRGSAAPVRRAG